MYFFIPNSIYFETDFHTKLINDQKKKFVAYPLVDLLFINQLRCFIIVFWLL
jgi:hypothetical protein